MRNVFIFTEFAVFGLHDLLRKNDRILFWTACLFLVTVSATFPGQVLAQTVPSTCDGVNYDCKAIEVTPHAYRRIETCGNPTFKASEALIYADELNAWNWACDLTTERIGWFTSTTSIWGCGVLFDVPSYNFGIEVNNASNYTFRYRTTCGSPLTESDVNVALRQRDVFCSGMYELYNGGTSGIARCRRESNRIDADKQMGKPKGKCCGNPINTAIANKFQEETDYLGSGVGGLVVRRYYNSAMDWGGYKTDYDVGSTWKTSTALGYGSFVKLAFQEEPNQHKVTALDSIGAQWRHFYQRGIYLNVTPTFITAMVFRHDGQVLPFNLHNGNYIPHGDINDRLVVLADGRFEFTDADDETIETYLSSGHLETIRHRNGMLHTVSYDTCMRIASVTDQFGHSLQFNYEHACGDSNKVYRVESITLPDGGTIDYGYNASTGTLTSVTYPDGTIRGYSYGWDNARRLTGITDEAGIQFASWTYGTTGKPITSQHAGGAGAVSVSYVEGVGRPDTTSATITDSLGAITKHFYDTKRGLNLITKVERPHPSGTGVMSENWTYDASGNVATYKNFRTYRTNYSYDLTRNLETSRTEGLNSDGTTNPETRSITTQWHATFRLPTLITETGRTTGFTYDANGNQLTRTITDTATSATRAWTWTYDSYGRVETEDVPRTDVSDVSTYTYYTCTTGYHCGQVATISNAAGHVTTYSTYNAHGQPLTILDANAVLTSLTYDARQRVTSRAIGGESTGFSY